MACGEHSYSRGWEDGSMRITSISLVQNGGYGIDKQSNFFLNRLLPQRGREMDIISAEHDSSSRLSVLVTLTLCESISFLLISLVLTFSIVGDRPTDFVLFKYLGISRFPVRPCRLTGARAQLLERLAAFYFKPRPSPPPLLCSVSLRPPLSSYTTTGLSFYPQNRTSLQAARRSPVPLGRFQRFRPPSGLDARPTPSTNPVSRPSLRDIDPTACKMLPPSPVTGTRILDSEISASPEGRRKYSGGRKREEDDSTRLGTSCTGFLTSLAVTSSVFLLAGRINLEFRRPLSSAPLRPRWTASTMTPKRILVDGGHTASSTMQDAYATHLGRGKAKSGLGKSTRSGSHVRRFISNQR